MTIPVLRSVLKERILVIDGAMGTMIQRHELAEADFRGTLFTEHPSPLQGNNDLLCLTQPDIVSEIHLGFLEAGSDIICTNTFNSTSISQADYQTEEFVYDINFHAAKLARDLCQDFTKQNSNKPRFTSTLR